MRVQRRNATNSTSMVQPADCEAIQEKMFELMDWVGTTERLSTETIPLLSKILNKPRLQWKNHRVSKYEKNYIQFGRENVSTSAVDTISSMSILDMKLYKSVESYYQYKEVITDVN